MVTVKSTCFNIKTQYILFLLQKYWERKHSFALYVYEEGGAKIWHLRLHLRYHSRQIEYYQI